MGGRAGRDGVKRQEMQKPLNSVSKRRKPED